MLYRQSGGCPSCGSPLLNLRTNDYSYRRCSKCIGVWMGRDVLTQLIEDILPGTAWKLKGSHDERQLQCPECHSPMHRAQVLHIPVDYCQPHSHGVWLDKDELRQILERVGETKPEAPEPPTSFTSLLSDFFSQ
jgi:Zn-finger nucleic acid-binding protein